MFTHVGLFVHSAVVFHVLCFFHVFVFYHVGQLIVRWCFIIDILLFIDLFSCTATNLCNKLTYLLTYRVGQKLHTKLMAIILSNLNRSSKFFHWNILFSVVNLQ